MSAEGLLVGPQVERFSRVSVVHGVVQPFTNFVIPVPTDAVPAATRVLAYFLDQIQRAEGATVG